MAPPSGKILKSKQYYNEKGRPSNTRTAADIIVVKPMLECVEYWLNMFNNGK